MREFIVKSSLRILELVEVGYLDSMKVGKPVLPQYIIREFMNIAESFGIKEDEKFILNEIVLSVKNYRENNICIY